MCGGRGTRLDADAEKPLYRVGGRPMVDRVADALADATAVDRTAFVVSPHAPATRDHVAERVATAADSGLVDAPGDGYVDDLGYALDRVGTPVATVAADLPLVAGDAVDGVLGAFSGDSLAVYVTAARKRRLGVSVDTTRPVDGRELAPTGLNVVADGDGEATLVVDDDRLAVNVNRPRDAAVATALLRAGGDGPGGRTTGRNDDADPE